MGMASLETFNMTPAICYEPGVAVRAAFVADGGQTDSSAMFHVAIDAVPLSGGGGVVDRAIVAIQAGGVGNLSGELASLPHMTRGTLFFEDRMRFGQAAA